MDHYNHSLSVDAKIMVFRATLFVLIAKHGAESGTRGETDVCAAIKTLESKLEKINALFTPPGKLELIDLQKNFLVSVFFIPSTSPKFNFITAVTASSCKELYDKHK